MALDTVNKEAEDNIKGMLESRGFPGGWLSHGVIEHIGLSPRQWTEFLRGRRELTAQQLYKLADFLGEYDIRSFFTLNPKANVSAG